MSAECAVRAGIIAQLAAAPGLTALNGVYDEQPVQASAPYAVIAESIAGDWSTKDTSGREVRVAVALFDLADTTDRLGQLASAAEVAIEALPRDLPGWRIATVTFLRSRTGCNGSVSDSFGSWSTIIEYRVRLLRTD